MRERPAIRVAGLGLVLAGLATSTLLATEGEDAARAPDAAAERVLAEARKQLGDAYQYGAAGPDRWDCSGLTSTMWRAAGGVSDIPRTSRDQQAWAWPIGADDARPGDLVFVGDPVSHVGLVTRPGRLLDASSSNEKVVERAIWSADVIRYGRVPRRGVAHPPSPSPSATPSPSPTGTGAAGPSASPSASASAQASQGARVQRPVPGRSHRPAHPPTAAKQRFVDSALHVLGAPWADHGTGPGFDAAGLVRWAWHRERFAVLPDTPAGIERLTRAVPLADLRVGDLIFYGRPAVHVGVYLGRGEMVDASKVLTEVVRRPVFSSETVRFARLPEPAVEPSARPSPRPSPSRSATARPSATPRPPSPRPTASPRPSSARPTSSTSPRPTSSPSPTRTR